MASLLHTVTDQTHLRTGIAALDKATKDFRLKSEEEDAFQNTPSSITTEVELIWPDSPPSNSKALVRKPNFVHGFCNPCLFHTLGNASLKPSFQIAALLGFYYLFKGAVSMELRDE